MSFPSLRFHALLGSVELDGGVDRFVDMKAADEALLKFVFILSFAPSLASFLPFVIGNILRRKLFRLSNHYRMRATPRSLKPLMCVADLSPLFFPHL